MKNPWHANVLATLLRLNWRRSARIWGSFIGVDMPYAWPPGLVLPHPYAVVIHGATQIGSNCVIYQGVTIGSDAAGHVPVIEDGVTIYAGACVIGQIVVGSGSTIGANSVVLSSVPSGSTVVGAPARPL